ncbi:23S rRNA (uracil(747)-C(5))-methyltransferase RlmC [Micrococcus yunnanensis]|uniref:23S rRNA (uracil(747)-C(5))-methyltransferase RlmC n=1 Tax=Micrococcus TaxID=1269 RepID=UPI001CA7548E|nr:23S rRNA (uracil(747)-C(5))-methyltransferase RlmC [Micrococcus luteus]QZY83978.1 23S rRNA (uracil(747)-C(5))-methyltransferase RlmC [Micrococcus luteus]
MQCPHFDVGECHSCPLMGVPYARQFADKQAAVLAELVDAVDADTVVAAPFASAEAGFRNKAKLVVTGSAAAPRLGILDPRQHPRHHDGAGVDLRDCGLYEAGMEGVFEACAAAVTAAGLEPYDVAARTGELKNVIVTLSPDREAMVRFVLRSADRLEALRAAVPGLLDDLAARGTPAAVVSANLLPEHVALPEGDEEIVLAGGPTLTMRLNGVSLRLRPQGFFQTNTAVTEGLYATAAAWITEGGVPASAWDLYCGVGGFAFHLARAGVRDVWGMESSAEAVAAAQETAAELGLADRVRFSAGDATSALSFEKRRAPEALSFEKRRAPEALSFEKRRARPDAVVVNPPRRGIGAELADALEGSGVPTVLYSSCNPATLAQDLARMPSYRVARVQVFDMFPQTRHAEVLTLLTRR